MAKLKAACAHYTEREREREREKRAMSAFSLSFVAPLMCQCSPPSMYHCKAVGSSLGSGCAFKVLSLNNVVKGSVFTNVASAASPPVGNVAPPLCRLLALGFCSIAVFGPFQPALAETVKQPNQEVPHQRPFTKTFVSSEIIPHSSATAPCLQALNSRAVENVVEKIHCSFWEDFFSVEKGHHSFEKNSILAEKDFQAVKKINLSSSSNVPLFHNQVLFQISSLIAEQPIPFLDFAGVLNPTRTNSLLSDIHTLEAETGWRLRIITKSGSSPTISGKDLKDLWKPDEKTVIIIEDLSSPNILNFNSGADVIVKLPRQFFLELQSRYGNQFYVQQEGEGAALMSTVQAIQECLSKPEGCKNVPGLTSDLYYLTLVTSIVGGCVFGFAARLPPSGRVESSWQWVLFLSPLWLLLFVSFGILPVVGRTSELEPLIKNTLGFSAGAIALYLTPIFGPSPISKR